MKNQINSIEPNTQKNRKLKVILTESQTKTLLQSLKIEKSNTLNEQKNKTSKR
jgi:hypothetical protein